MLSRVRQGKKERKRKKGVVDHGLWQWQHYVVYHQVLVPLSESHSSVPSHYIEPRRDGQSFGIRRPCLRVGARGAESGGKRRRIRCPFSPRCADTPYEISTPEPKYVVNAEGLRVIYVLGQR